MSDVPNSIWTEGSWGDANQARLVAEFARLRRRVRCILPVPTDWPSEDYCDFDVESSLDPPAAIDRLSDAFGLTLFERDVLLLCAGVEMDSRLAAMCSEALGFPRHDRRGAITFSLALSVLEEPSWNALAPSAPLRCLRLVELEAGRGLTSAPLRVDERILHYLAGVNRLDARLEPILESRHCFHRLAVEHDAAAQAALRSIDFLSSDAPILHLCGDDRCGQEDVASVVAEHLGRQLFILPVEKITDSFRGGLNGTDSVGASNAATQFVARWTREEALLPGLLLVQCGTGSLTSAARHVIERLSAPFLLASSEPLRIERMLVRHMVDKPGPSSQKQLWARALGPAGSKLNGKLDDIAHQFRLSAQTIASVGSASSSTAVDAAALWSTCRSLSRPRLEDLAQRITPAAGWQNLILPEPQMQTLLQLEAQVRHRMTVYESWGFAGMGRRGLGISALFAGASGTGKTLAAEVLANELGLDLYRIDLSAVVSKYIGESEKNLKQVFDAAEEGGVLLLFDECDALFGKRTEGKDSHDRYANIEVSYLLQRMESFQGLAILTTNFKAAMDKAFQRRLRFTVDFPFPGAAERKQLWKLAFPKDTPTQGIDVDSLAQLNMTGGNIRNIALNAAFFAAAEVGRGPVMMKHLLLASRQEAIKVERPLAENEIRGWV